MLINLARTRKRSNPWGGNRIIMALFTQGAQKIEVIVRKEDIGAATAGANDESPESAGKVGEQGAESSGTSSIDTVSGSKIGRRITATKMLSASIAVGRLWMNYYAGGTAYRNGDTAMQEGVQRNFEMVEEGAGLLLSIGIGATYGARGGVPGMILGGVLAAGTTATSLGFKYAGRNRDYNMKMFKEENAIEYKRARANLSLTTGRLR